MSAEQPDVLPEAPPPTVFVRPSKSRDDAGVPALLVRPSVVLVPRPPERLLDQGAELQVVVVALEPAVSVERTRVAMASVLPSDAAGGPLLTLGLERPSVSRPCPIGTVEEEALLHEVAVALKDGDLWGTLVALGRVTDLPAAIPPETIDAIRAYEAEQHPPQWPPPEVESFIGDVLRPLFGGR